MSLFDELKRLARPYAEENDDDFEIYEPGRLSGNATVPALK